MTMTPEQRDAAAPVLKAMAHPVRLGVLERLAMGEQSVTELYSTLGCSQSVMSNQLSILKAQGLIAMRREGSIKYCSLRNPDFIPLFNCLARHVTGIQRH